MEKVQVNIVEIFDSAERCGITLDEQLFRYVMNTVFPNPAGIMQSVMEPVMEMLAEQNKKEELTEV